MIFVEADKKVSSTGVPLKEGNGNIIADTLSVYVDDNKFGYVASNSLQVIQLQLTL